MKQRYLYSLCSPEQKYYIGYTIALLEEEEVVNFVKRRIKYKLGKLPDLLLEDLDKFTIDAFEIKALDGFLENSELKEKKKAYLAKYNAVISGYNKDIYKPHSDEWRLKVSKAQKERWANEEFRARCLNHLDKIHKIPKNRFLWKIEDAKGNILEVNNLQEFSSSINVSRDTIRNSRSGWKLISIYDTYKKKFVDVNEPINKVKSIEQKANEDMSIIKILEDIRNEVDVTV